ncbi:hypothetical protein [Methylovulum psychrotolerans]|uniref:Uncharacterized protein n=1 Tax=Methylovulum psychrotolerans TaxID=1704499 RepID=A0A2S5CI60_9GAMM|nr:hypothetical protein [Methylovulum psychrotolerans]POZ50422.1 hypothetical protein AADEFJLK_03835 [Methylovulum psychrotolerans]
MTLSFEVLLFLGVVGFYLSDSIMLLYANEWVFSQTHGKWAFALPQTNWQLLRKHLYWPNPFTPARPLFRVFWSAADSRPHDPVAFRHFLSALKRLRYPLYSLLVLQLVGLPAVLFGLGANLGLLILFGAVYLNIAVLSVQVYRYRAALGLSKKGVAKLAFDSLACPPLALNLLRKISLQSCFIGDPVAFAHQSFDPITFEQLRKSLCQQVDKAMRFEDEASPKYAQLQAYHNRIMEMRPYSH